MYVKAKRGRVIAYPYTDFDLRRDNPNVSFPAQMTLEDYAAFDMHPVSIESVPYYDERTQVCRLGKGLAEVNGKWTLQYEVVDKSQEEIEAHERAAAARVRFERDRRLQECDWVTLRAAEHKAPCPPAWLEYRQRLRDITENVKFPYLDAQDWPDAPNSN